MTILEAQNRLGGRVYTYRRHRRWIEAALLSAVKNAYAIQVGIRNEIPGDVERS